MGESQEMYAIVATSGKQFRVTEGDRILVDRVQAAVGDTVRLESVLLLDGAPTPLVGRPFVTGAAIEATVLAHRAGDKVIVFKYKPKKRERRKHGHRQLLSELKIAAIYPPAGAASAGKAGAGTTAPANASARAGRSSTRSTKGAKHGT